jgi:hypothetical protein
MTVPKPFPVSVGREERATPEQPDPITSRHDQRQWNHHPLPLMRGWRVRGGKGKNIHLLSILRHFG